MQFLLILLFDVNFSLTYKMLESFTNGNIYRSQGFQLLSRGPPCETSPTKVFLNYVSTPSGRKLICCILVRHLSNCLSFFTMLIRNMTPRKVYQLALILSCATWENVFFIFMCQLSEDFKRETIKAEVEVMEPCLVSEGFVSHVITVTFPI